MIIVMLNGGLGNQMFQYAFGRALSIALKNEFKVDISWYKETPGGVTRRGYELECFDMNTAVAVSKEIFSMKKIAAFLPRQIFNFFYKKLPILRGSYCKERFYHYDSTVWQYGDNTYFEGYWQSYRYFDKYKEVIRKDFIYKDELSSESKRLQKKIILKNAVSLHVRRGDYVTNSNANGFHGVIPLQYYEEAVEYIAKRANGIDIFVFSDDIKWVKENMNVKFPVTFIPDSEKKKPFEDMYLMSLCKHNIIANSSFSWWGAYLNTNDEKIVIAPKKWFTDPFINTQDLIPKEWVRL
jgi:hypothetical protein